MRRFSNKLVASLMSLSLVTGLFSGVGGQAVYAADPEPSQESQPSTQNEAVRYEMEDGTLTGAAKALTDKNGVGYVFFKVPRTLLR